MEFLLSTLCNYFFGSVGANGISADTNIEFVLGVDGSRGVNNA
jgi:hypothetical protein